MNDMAKQARAAMKAKAKNLAGGRDPSQKVDASSWTPPEPLNADIKTGMRPISRRQYKKGGVVKGEAVAPNLGRKPRKSGGVSWVNDKINRNVKEANEERPGIKHIGGMKKGGRAKKANGGDLIRDIIESEQIEEALRKRPKDLPDFSEEAPEVEETIEYISPRAKDLYEGRDLERIEENRKSGGRTKKQMGGPMGAMGPRGRIDPRMLAALKAEAAKGKRAMGPAAKPFKEGGRSKKQGGGPMMPDPRLNMVPRKTMQFTNNPVVPGQKDGGKVKKKSHMEWEHSREDLVQDKKLARKHGMSMDKWEDSSLDKKHDRQQSMEGLKSGGKANKWIQSAIRKPGALHRQLDVPEGEKIPAKKLAKAAEKGGKLGQRARMAETLKRMNRKDGGKTNKLSLDGELQGTRPVGGRIAKARGGMMDIDLGGKPKKSKKSKGKNDINIIIALNGKDNAGDMAGQPRPIGAMGGMPPAPPPGAMPPAASPGPGAFPGASAGPGAPAGAPGAPPMPGPSGFKPPMPPMMGPGRKAGGRAMSYKDMTAGAGSGEGRLEKTEIAKHHRKQRKTGGRSYRSYKDMDAGAGSGRGRLEKTEIQSRKG